MKTFMLVLAGLFWSVLVLLCDGRFGYAIVKQIASRHYSATSGRILQSKVTRTSDLESGYIYSAVITYNYLIENRIYTNDRYRYISLSSSKADTENEKTKKFPVDSEVTVFYNPNNPHDSLLDPRFTELDAFIPIMVFPFNVIMFFFWRAGFSSLHRRFRRPEAGGLEVIRHPRQVRLRVVRFSPFASGLFASGCAGLLGFIAGAGSSRTSTSLKFPLVTGSIILAVGFGTRFLQRKRQNSGDYDLVINKAQGRLIFPVNQKAHRNHYLFLNDVIAVSIEKNEHAKSEGEPEYHNKLHLKNPERCEDLCHWLGPVRSSELADWLSKELGVRREPDRTLFE